MAYHSFHQGVFTGAALKAFDGAGAVQAGDTESLNSQMMSSRVGKYSIWAMDFIEL